jgi:hypothetical protein
MNTQTGSRLVFRNAKDALMKANINPRNAILSQSYLRFENFLSTTKTSYDFGVLNNQTISGQAQAATEQRLNLQDCFYISEIMVYIAKASSATANDFKLCTYPSPQIFTTALAAPALYTLYNGVLSLTVNNRNIVPNSDLTKFLQIPQTQATGAANSPIDQFDGGYGSVVEPNLVLVGQKNSLFNITIPSAFAALDAHTKVIIIVRGVLAQNVTSVS